MPPPTPVLHPLTSVSRFYLWLVPFGPNKKLECSPYRVLPFSPLVFPLSGQGLSPRYVTQSSRRRGPSRNGAFVEYKTLDDQPPFCDITEASPSMEIFAITLLEGFLICRLSLRRRASVFLLDLLLITPDFSSPSKMKA